jgi:hypothetical protein
MSVLACLVLSCLVRVRGKVRVGVRVKARVGNSSRLGQCHKTRQDQDRDEPNLNPNATPNSTPNPNPNPDALTLILVL